MSRAASKTAEEAPRISAEMRAKYECVIGLEVHAQLMTQTKMFCACSTRFGDPPNQNTCPVCLGLPGALPVPNAKALELAVRAALALHCEVQERSQFARKNYFYPDLPKGYQISQYELPLARTGWLEIEHAEQKKRIGITRLHMEEDAAKNLHEGFPDSDRYSHIDFNRCGVPLIEIVSEPDLRAPEEAYAYLANLKQALEYTEVSDCNMEEGSLRCDANVSVRLRGAEKFGTKVEMKNLNSFRYLQHALEYEIERQIGVLEAGGTILQETRLWNVAAGRTESMRSKEFAHDYRYFPDPDLLPVHVSDARKAEILRKMPELPWTIRERFIEYGTSAYDASVLTATRPRASYFETLHQAGPKTKEAGKSEANWMQTELLRRLDEAGKDITESPVTPQAFQKLITLERDGKITTSGSKTTLKIMFESGRDPEEIIAAEGLSPISDTESIEKTCREVIAKNADNVTKYRSGNEGVFKFFVGQVMKETRGRANPQTVNDILKRLLDKT